MSLYLELHSFNRTGGILGDEMSYQYVRLGFFIIFVIFISFFFAACNMTPSSKNDTTLEVNKEYIYGITLDSIEEVNKSVDALRSFSKRVSTRVVFDEYVPASVYKNAVHQLSLESDIMGEILDSQYLALYGLEDYKQRVDEYLNTLGQDVTLWEIGNEVNGEWTGKPKEVAEKILYAYQSAKKRGYKTVLTLYYNDYDYNDGCWKKEEEKMRDWVDTYLDKNLIQNLDYVLLSYYEEDCDGYRPTLSEWQSVFDELGKTFPNSKLGFGEVGTSNSSQKLDYLRRYYTMEINHPRYIGGYFWWYGKQDMVPKTKVLWRELNSIL